jgi:hypothetical protein
MDVMAKNKSEVTSIGSQKDLIVPPEDWNPRSSFGFMGYDSSDAGRLVRLADVLRWRMKNPRPDSHASALAAVCYATQVSPDDLFGYRTQAQIDAETAQARQVAIRKAALYHIKNGFALSETGNMPVHRKSVPSNPGRPALLRHIGEAWSVELWKGQPAVDHAKTLASYLAVPLDKAALHWGFGQVQSGSQADQQGLKSDRYIWTPDLRKKLADDFDNAKGKTVKERHEVVAKKWGFSVSNVKKELIQAKKERKEGAVFADMTKKINRAK